MNKRDLLAMAFQNLWRRKLRTFLTVLGVLIGTTSIVVMMSLGLAMQKQQEDMIKNMGGLTTINVQPTNYWDPSQGSRIPKTGLIDDAVLKKIKETPHVTATMPTIAVNNATLYAGKYQFNGQLVGVDPQHLSEFDYHIGEGRLLQSSDLKGILFPQLQPWMFEDYSRLEHMRGDMSKGPEELKVNVMKDRMHITIGYKDRSAQFFSDNSAPTSKDLKAETVGILAPNAGGSGMGMSRAFISLDFAKKINKESARLQASQNPDQAKASPRSTAKTFYTNVDVKIDDIDNFKIVKSAIEELELQAFGMGEFIDQMTQGALIAQGILGGIGSISLIVAAIGITNTMVMSIYERTKEIGVMKVIGASVNDVKQLFLVEAAMIGLLGGFIGLMLSYGLSALLNTVLGPMFTGAMGGISGEQPMISVIPIWLGLAALLFSIFVGLVSGYYPAKKATKLSAIEAIRTQ